MRVTWRVHTADPERADALARALGLRPLTGQLLLNRGISDRQEAERFLHPELGRLSDPKALPDLERAVARFVQAARRKEPVLVFGDSDVDGLTGSVILYEALERIGARVEARQSNRITDGYGLPEATVEAIERSPVKLLVLVDCGTNQPEAVKRLTARGIDTVIVDHHVPLDDWAKPYALVNPHRDQESAYHGLSSAGLAFKVAQALLAQAPAELAALVDLAALGSLADCSPLTGEGRIIICAGLTRIVQSRRPGLAKLCELTDTSKPDPEEIIRRLVPRLNASGRLGDAAAVWQLLHSDSPDAIEPWVASTDAAHAATRQLHRRTLAEAQAQVGQFHFRDELVMVVSRAGWHQGVMGPLASRLAEQYGRPAIAIAMHEQHGTGSARSIPMFNMLEALQACREVLVRYGGHAQACGLTVGRQHLDRFRAMVNEEARRLLGPEGPRKIRMADCELTLGAIEPGWVAESEGLSPFGRGNPRPTVWLRQVAVEVDSPRRGTVTDGAHRLPIRGELSAFGEGRYDVIAAPSMIDGAVALTLAGVTA